MKLIDIDNSVVTFSDRANLKTLFRLTGEKFQQHQVFYSSFKNNPTTPVLYIADLEGIDYMSARTMGALVSASLDYSRQYEMPFILTNALQEVLEGLRNIPSPATEDRHLWVMDSKGNAEVLGYIPERMREIVYLLREQKDFTITASELPILQGHEIPEKATANSSVYLQEMYKMGLLLRTKIRGTSRSKTTRGWTYAYHLPWKRHFD